ncbi:MAG: ATP-binding domain-containing protein [Hydrogenibacillus schlegelii]|uniref:ATP-binding domain-containing protein n=1 Tax=Hydrogenibacillus schlegelii TaxID=1484 RepID=A0A947GHD2_HYDSH|nr:ATP-binding domain-containing protein [Hydrogenibacillus schlegelii]
MKEELDELRALIKDMERDYARRARVVGTSLAKAVVDEAVFQRTFDLVIIDEASMVSAPYVLFAAHLAARKMVICGDFKQLPPIAQSRHEPVQKWLGKDIFALTGITEGVESGRWPDQLVMLREQRRMHEEISRHVNRLFYHGLLNDHPDVKKRQSIVERDPFPGSAVMWIDVSAAGAFTHKEQGGHSRFNLLTALFSLLLIGRALNAGHRSIGYIAPYVAQAQLVQAFLRDLFPEARGSERAVVASTVHRFQGLEKDVILFDAVDGPPFSKAGVLLEGDAAARLINVAMSRARGKLIILGNRTFLQDRLSAEHPLNRLSRELEARGRIVDLRNVLDFQADGMGAAGEALAIVPIERADEADADEADADRNRAFRDDLRSAEELIVLRTDESARYDLFPELQALKDRGRKIVFLKARSDAPAVAASPEHIRQGWEVRDIPARYAGEEWALIDNRLLWYVSRERSSGFGIRVASSRGLPAV